MSTSTMSKDAPLVYVPDGIALAYAIVATVRNPLVVLDPDLRIIAASRSFYQVFSLIQKDVRGHLLYEIEGGQWNTPRLREMLETVMRDGAAIEGYEISHDVVAVGQRIMLLNARVIVDEGGNHTNMLLEFDDITGRHAVEQRVQELLREKDLLLDEMYHRVANSLQIIASILLIKARAVQSEETRAELKDAHQRVMSVAAVQQHLHLSARGESIEIGNYLAMLSGKLAESMIGESRAITLSVDADAGTVTGRDAVSIGLIVTELVINALKHAFTAEKPGGVVVVSYKIAGKGWRLTVADNGIGMPDPGLRPLKGGLGTSLVQALARQLDASIDIVGKGGTSVSIIYPAVKAPVEGQAAPALAEAAP